VEIEPLTFKEIREIARTCENGQPCIFDLEIIGKVSRVQLKRKELKSKVKEYYSVTIRSLQDESDYFIVHIDKGLLNKSLSQDKILYVRGTLFKIEDFVFLNASKVYLVE